MAQEESKANKAKEDKASKWRVKQSQTGFVPDENKQVRQIDLLAVQPT